VLKPTQKEKQDYKRYKRVTILLIKENKVHSNVLQQI
jgi:hypothetical protein